uniref:Crustin-like protein fc-2 n=1 Tax=Penaeus chinensis TaxID=139456 RepID=Q102W4_PENCE|nr:crustin-like protein fc-2 [Penaeus chinensis]
MLKFVVLSVVAVAVVHAQNKDDTRFLGGVPGVGGGFVPGVPGHGGVAPVGGGLVPGGGGLIPGGGFECNYCRTRYGYVCCSDKCCYDVCLNDTVCKPIVLGSEG